MAPGTEAVSGATFEQLQAYIAYEDAAAVRDIAMFWWEFQKSLDDAADGLNKASGDLFGSGGWTGGAANAFRAQGQRVLTSVRGAPAGKIATQLDWVATRVTAAV